MHTDYWPRIQPGRQRVRQLYDFIHTHNYSYVFGKKYSDIHTDIHKYVYIPMYIYIYTYLCIYIHICIYIYTHVYIYMYTYMYTYVPLGQAGNSAGGGSGLHNLRITLNIMYVFLKR